MILCPRDQECCRTVPTPVIRRGTVTQKQFTDCRREEGEGGRASINPSYAIPWYSD